MARVPVDVGATMLPDNILGRWVVTDATLTDLKSALNYYVSSSVEREYDSGFHSFHWLERTSFAVADSRWSMAEGSLIFENRRAVLWRADAENLNRSHVIFFAMFPASLANLERSVTDSLEASVEAVDLGLDRVAGIFSSEKIAGAEIVDSEMRRVSFRGNDVPPIPVLRMALGLTPNMGLFDVSRLHLRLGSRPSDVIVGQDGSLTFTDPHLSLAEIVEITTELMDNFPRRRQRSGGGNFFIGNDLNRSSESGSTL